MHRAATKAKGNISSVFAHLGASHQSLDPRFVELKRQIAPKDPAVLKNAFDRVLRALDTESNEIQRRGSGVIPEVTMDDIKLNGGKIPEKLVPEVHKRGAIVIRNIVDRAEAKAWKDQIQEYIQKHPGIAGFPEENPQVWELYWTKAQVAARSHTNFNAAAIALNSLWHAHPDTPVDLTKNLTYCDRLRIRQPDDGEFKLAGHIDGGSLERWEDLEYRKCYTNILEGKWEDYDPYDATHRIGANMDLYDAPGGCSMFRIFQGWLSISKVTPNGGTLRVCPLIKEPTAYFMMKPLLEEHLGKSDLMGAWPGRCQDITEQDHPHIVNNMVSVPPVDFGDGVFWHCDQVHAVEPKNEMKTDSSVLYIPSTPLCPSSSEYLLRQRTAFEKGKTPPDFPANDCEEHFDDRAKPEDLTVQQKLGMGFLPFNPDAPNLTSGQRRVIQEHNRILGL